MGLRQKLGGDEGGTSFEGIALSVSIIAVAFVASADMLDYMTRSRHELPSSTVTASRDHKQADKSAKETGLDYTPTASLPEKASRTVLNPCVAAPR